MIPPIYRKAALRVFIYNSQYDNLIRVFLIFLSIWSSLAFFCAGTFYCLDQAALTGFLFRLYDSVTPTISAVHLCVAVWQVFHCSLRSLRLMFELFYIVQDVFYVSVCRKKWFSFANANWKAIATVSKIAKFEEEVRSRIFDFLSWRFGNFTKACSIMACKINSKHTSFDCMRKSDSCFVHTRVNFQNVIWSPFHPEVSYFSSWIMMWNNFANMSFVMLGC